MTNVAISVEALSKRYRIGAEEEKADTLTKAIARLVTSPAKNLRKLRRLSTFGSGGDQAENLIWALRDVSFEVEQGEIVGVIGPNGAGKSTLLKVLSRITPPTEGRVTLHGRVSSLLEVGTGFHQELTGRENVYMNGTVLGMSRKEVDRKFDDIVDFAGVEKFMDTPVKRYSSGMKMRLAFSVAAHLEPEILLIDEVLAVGDAEFQKKCLGRMEKVAGEGRTVLFVSHNMSAVNRLCPRTIMLDGGVLVEDGDTSTVTAAYLGVGSSELGTKTWSRSLAPGRDGIKLRMVALEKSDGQAVNVVNVEERLELRIGYDVEKPSMQFRCAVQLYTQGICAFSTIEPTEVVRNGPDYHESIVSIPPNLLTEGQYTIQVSIYQSYGAKHRYAAEQDVIGFQVYDMMTGSSARGDHAQSLNGVVRPLLKWRTSGGKYHATKSGSKRIESAIT